ncbi:MAG: repressor LexA [Clostridia bacterium]|nr:repressor LexA [Clostridia bacterium]
MKKQLIQKEQQVYEYIRKCLEFDTIPPSIRDICNAVGVSSTATAAKILHRLEEKDLITITTGKCRSIRLKTPSDSSDRETCRVPLLSKVSGNHAVVAAENIDGYVDFPAILGKGRANLFALRITGNGMKESGVLDGDIVIAESGRFLDEGLIAADCSGSILVGRLFSENGNYLLKVCPGSGPDQILHMADFSILGRVIADYRFY